VFAQSCFSLVRKAEPSRLEPFFLTLRLVARSHERLRAEEAQLRLFGSLREEGLDLGLGPRPVAELDERGEEMGMHLGAGPVLREQLSVGRDLLLGSGARSEDRALPEAGLEVIGAHREDLVESSVGVIDQPDPQQGTADADPGRQEPWLQFRGLAIEPKGEGRDPQSSQVRARCMIPSSC